MQRHIPQNASSQNSNHHKNANIPGPAGKQPPCVPGNGSQVHSSLTRGKRTPEPGRAVAPMPWRASRNFTNGCFPSCRSCSCSLGWWVLPMWTVAHQASFQKRKNNCSCQVMVRSWLSNRCIMLNAWLVMIYPSPWPNFGQKMLDDVQTQWK